MIAVLTFLGIIARLRPVKKLYSGVLGLFALLLLIGCGGKRIFMATGGTDGTTAGVGSNSGSPGAPTTSGSNSGGVEPPASNRYAGSYSGSYGGISFGPGGGGQSSDSGSATLTISSTGALKLSLGTNVLNGSVTDAGVMSGTYVYNNGSASKAVTGTVTRSGSTSKVRFTSSTDSTKTSGINYTATVYSS